MLGYKIVFVSDANAALSDEEQNASLLNMTTIFGEVRDTAGTIELITQQHAASFAGAGQRSEDRQPEVSATARIGSP